MSLGFGDLVLCAGTVPLSGLEERAAAAGRAGFRGISLFADDYLRARGRGRSDADLRAILSDSGVSIAELDPLLRWIPGVDLGGEADAQGRAFFEHGEDRFYAIAEALGARSLNAALVAERTLEPDVIAEAFAGLCDRAAAHGLLVHLEFLPWTQIRDARAALEIVTRADRPNGGIMLDTWHHYRSGADAAEIPAERVFGVQINDAPARAESDLVDETSHRRLLPGDGDIDLTRVLMQLAAGGCRAPIGVEVFSDVLAPRPVEETARRAFEACRPLLARAGIEPARSPA